MSSELTVDLTIPFVLKELLESSRKIIVKVLKYTNPIVFKVFLVEKGVFHTVDISTQIDLTCSKLFYIEIVQLNCTASLHVIVDEDGKFAAISPEKSRKPLDYLFCLFISVALAEMENTIIEDDNELLKYGNEISAIIVEEMIAINKDFDTIQIAAEEIYRIFFTSYLKKKK